MADSPLRIVADTNVLVSALLQPLGPSARILELWAQSRIELITCPELLGELLDVVARPRLRRRISRDQAAELDALLRSQSELRPDPSFEEGLTRDPKDDYIVALAQVTSVDCIVSGDQHLTELEGLSPPVLTPAAFLAFEANRRG